MARFACSVVAVLLAAGSRCQSAVVTVRTGDALDLRAEHYTVAPLDVAALAGAMDVTPGFTLGVESGGAHCTAVLRVDATPVPVVDLEVAASAYTFDTAGGALVTAAVDLRVAIAVPTAVPGAVTVWIRDVPSGGVPAVGVTRVDLDADGTWEVVGNPASYPQWAYAEFARDAGPNPLAIRILHTGTVAVGPHDIGDYASRVVVQWIPHSGPVDSVAPGCGMLMHEARAANGDFVFTGSPAATAATWFLVGLQPQNLPLPLPPYCSLRLVIDGFAPWPGGAFVVSRVVLPPGFTVHAQAVTFESPAMTRLSNLLRLHVGT